MYSFLHDESNFARLNKQLRASWQITFVAVELHLSYFLVCDRLCIVYSLSKPTFFEFHSRFRYFCASQQKVLSNAPWCIHNICNFRSKFCIQRLNYTEIIPKVDDEISKQRLHSLFPVFDPELLQKISRMKRPTST